MWQEYFTLSLMSWHRYHLKTRLAGSNHNFGVRLLQSQPDRTDCYSVSRFLDPRTELYESEAEQCCLVFLSTMTNLCMYRHTILSTTRSSRFKTSYTSMQLSSCTPPFCGLTVSLQALQHFPGADRSYCSTYKDNPGKLLVDQHKIT